MTAMPPENAEYLPGLSPLEHIRAQQNDDLHLASDAALQAFLAEVSVEDVLRDRLPRTAVELRHLARAQKGAA